MLLCRSTLVILGFITMFLSLPIRNMLMVPLGAALAFIGILLRSKRLRS